MDHPGLKARMVVAGSIVFAFYAAFALVLRGFGYGLPVVLAASVVFVAAQYKLGKWLALRGASAEELPESEHPDVHRVVEDLSEEMGLPKPRLMVGTMGVPNAFAVGRKGAGVVVVSETMFDLLEPEELHGVLAHELAHLENRDVTMLLLGQSIASMISIAVFWVIALADDSIVFTIVGWLASALVNAAIMVFVLTISRHREYVADAAGATGDPEALGRALAKIASVGRHDDAPDVSDRVGALCIFGGKRGFLATLFSTHPPVEERIARLAPELLD